MSEIDAPADGPSPPARRRAPTRRLKETPLTEADWIEAATAILVDEDENVRGIRIAALCRRLGVTKGSFYWHFAGRPQLLAALLANWRRRMTTAVIEGLGARSGGAAARLRALLELPRRPRAPAFARVEQAIRDWSRRDARAAEAVREVDAIRLAYFEGLLREAGLDAETARRRAYLAYAMMMGDSVLRRTLEAEGADAAVIDEVTALLTRPADRG